MCGIAGFWLLESPRVVQNSIDHTALLDSMGESISHRGPDHQGIWIDSTRAFHCVHRRLSIIDISVHGNQPMISHGSRYCIVFNGEIYNYRWLRSQINNHSNQSWRSDSDTEVLLQGIEVFGFKYMLENAEGQFAFALWDDYEKNLVFARDRYGEKPLYFGDTSIGLAFASELKVLERIPSFKPSIDEQSLASYFVFGSIGSPGSIYDGVFKLSPGSYAVAKVPKAPVSTVKYYDAIKTSKKISSSKNRNVDEHTHLHQVETALRTAVSSRMQADVPLGAFLSGGYDSSLIVSLMQELSAEPIQTFTIGFKEKTYDESVYARLVAEKLGTKHTEHQLTAEDLLASIPEISHFWDEPFADSSQVPTRLVSKVTRQFVTVALSGDGGDELFCGYRRYGEVDRIHGSIQKYPLIVRNLAGKLAQAIYPSVVSKTRNPASQNFLLEKLYRFIQLAPLFASSSEGEIYARYNTYSTYANRLLTTDRFTVKEIERGIVELFATLSGNRSFIENMALCDVVNYLPNTILTKVDRASMSNSLESRAPLLDSQLFECVCALPLNMKHRNGVSKYALKKIANARIGEDIMDRPKKGFSVPIGEWLKGPLMIWVEDTLSYDTIKRQGYLNPDYVQGVWQAHKSNIWNHEHQLWTILMFQSWLSKKSWLS